MILLDCDVKKTQRECLLTETRAVVVCTLGVTTLVDSECTEAAFTFLVVFEDVLVTVADGNKVSTAGVSFKE